MSQFLKVKNRFVNLSFNFYSPSNPFTDLILNLIISNKYNEEVSDKYFNDDDTYYDDLNEVKEYKRFVKDFYNVNKNYLSENELQDFLNKNCDYENPCNCCSKFNFVFKYDFVFQYVQKKYFNNKQQITCDIEHSHKILKMKFTHTIHLFNNEIKMNMYKH